MTATRLAIAGQCSDDKRPLLNDELKRVSALATEPAREKEIPQ